MAVSFLVSWVDTDGYLAALAPGVALNWLGILITVFSLSVTFFLAVMAIEAFSHMSFLREATEKYEEFVKRLERDEERFEVGRNALQNYNNEILPLIDFFIQQSDLPPSQKLHVSERMQIARARLELTNLQADPESEFDEVVRHVLVLAEHGGKSDLRFALDVLKRQNQPELTHELAGEIIRDLRSRQ
ncbi:MAG: hypothetical protein ABJF50_06905 [Paracoccaceae bacterium]